MLTRTEFWPGSVAPEDGVYRLMNVFGSRTGHCVHVQRNGRQPDAPRRFSWRWEREAADDRDGHP